MDISVVLIWFVAILAIALIVAGIVASFRKVSEGDASIDLWGIKVSGKGGASVLFVFGLALLLIGWKWNQDQQQKLAAARDAAGALKIVDAQKTVIQDLSAEVSPARRDSITGSVAGTNAGKAFVLSHDAFAALKSAGYADSVARVYVPKAQLHELRPLPRPTQ